MSTHRHPAALLLAVDPEQLPPRPPAPLAPQVRRAALAKPAATWQLGCCALCLAVLRPQDAHVQEHRDPRGAAVRILWCHPCADADDLLKAIADNESRPDDDPEATDRFTDLHRALHDRVLAQGGAAGLRAVFHVVRDYPREVTLRAPGARWGLPTARSLP